MAQDIQDSGHGGSRRIFYSVLCLLLLLPFPIPILHGVFGVFTYAQAAYGELGIVAALLCSLMASVKPVWGKLLAVQAFVVLGFAPRLLFPISTGVLDMTLPQFLILAATPSVFAAVFLTVHRLLARRESAYTRNFVYAMCLAAFCMHALLLPVLLGEPLRSHILHVASPGEEIIETNPSGTLLLTHSALVPVKSTLYAHHEGQLDLLRQESLPGYPVGIRVRDDDALIALRMQNEDKVVKCIDFVRFSPSGLDPVRSYPCTPEENPSHMVNNLSPDGGLLALADGAFVNVATGTRVELLPPDANPHGGLVFVQWSEPEGRAFFYHESEQRLLLLDTSTGIADSYTLRGSPESARAVSVLPGARQVWYEETPLFIEQVAFLENLADQKRTRITRKQGKARPGTALLWTGEQRLTYITALGALDSLNFDRERKRFQWERHTQLLDMTAHAALANESNWLFWVTQAPHGEGTAIHGKQLR